MEKIKLVCLGDSISAGFSTKTGYSSPGLFKNNIVQGISFPAFIAKFINQSNCAELNSFDNFSFPTINSIEFSSLLDRKKWVGMKAIRHMDKESSNVLSGNQMSHLFTHNDFNYDYLIDKINNATDILISLGANDFLQRMPFNLILGLLNEDDSIRDLKTLKKNIENVVEQNSIDLGFFIKKIIELNPQARISIVSYPHPFMHFEKILSEINKFWNIDSNFIEEIVLNLNKTLSQLAVQYNCNFFNSWDEEDWRNNIWNYSNNIFDIHPTELGQFHISKTLLPKLFSPDIHDRTPVTIGKYSISDYIVKPISITQNNYKKLLKVLNDFDTNNIKINNTQYNISPIFEAHNSIENHFKEKYKNLLNLNWKNLFRNETLTGLESLIDGGREMYFLAKIQGLLLSFIEERTFFPQTKNKIINYLKDFDNIEKIFLMVLKSNQIRRLVLKFQNTIRRYCKSIKLMDTKTLIRAVVKTLKENENVFYEVIIKIIGKPEFHNTKFFIVELIDVFMTEIKSNKADNFENKNLVDILKIIHFWTDNPYFDDLVKTLKNVFFNSGTIAINSVNFVQYFEKLIEFNKSTIVEKLSEYINYYNNIEFNKFESMLSDVFEYLIPNNEQNKNINDIKKRISKLFKSLLKNNKKLIKLANSILSLLPKLEIDKLLLSKLHLSPWNWHTFKLFIKKETWSIMFNSSPILLAKIYKLIRIKNDK